MQKAESHIVQPLLQLPRASVKKEEATFNRKVKIKAHPLGKRDTVFSQSSLLSLLNYPFPSSLGTNY
ncbi:hypothetical protein EVA_21842 [gut metagenome]|uniref:Uncharacterized protein n=1 Tax=gut metagenome TaxID=749906 RepID=J9F6I2_9ZZZZ